MSTTSPLIGPAARRERGRLEMQASIIDAARQIVASSGVEGLTIRGVAKALGYSPGALYEYFDSKEAILTSLYFEGSNGLGGAMERAVADLPADTSTVTAIQMLGRAYRRFALEHADLYKLIFGGSHVPKRPPTDRSDDDGAGGFGTLVRLVHQGIADGTLSSAAPPMSLAFALWSSVHGFVSLEIGDFIRRYDQPGDLVEGTAATRDMRDAMFESVLAMSLFGLVQPDRDHGRSPPVT